VVSEHQAGLRRERAGSAAKGQKETKTLTRCRSKMLLLAAGRD
jgi:hypothetical protein